MKKEYKVTGMSCQHCVKAIEMELKSLELISFNVEIGIVKVEFDDDKVNENEISAAIVEAGFTISE